MIEETRLDKSLWSEAAVHCGHVMRGSSYYEFVHTSVILASKTFQLHYTDSGFLRKTTVVIFRNFINIHNL